MLTWLFRDFAGVHQASLNESYTKMAATANTDIAGFHTAMEAMSGPDKTTFDTLKAKLAEPLANMRKHGEPKGYDYVLKESGDKKAFDEARAAYLKAENQVKSFLRGEKVEGFEKISNSTIKDAFVKAETAANKVAKPVNSFVGGIVRTQEGGWSKALKHNGSKMQFWKEGMEPGARGKAFAHGSAVVGAAIGLGDAVLRSKTADGEDRSGVIRVLEAVGAGALGTAALLGGRAAVALR